MYRRKGKDLRSSKTGSIAYIEPEATLKYSQELSNLYMKKGKSHDIKTIIE
jgi:DNA mismatch repair protein MutS2